VERIGVERTLAHAAEAELIVAVFDSSRPLEAEDRRVIELCRNRAGVAILNKRDLPSVLSCQSLGTLQMPLLPFSALKADGLETLRDELTRAVEALAGGPAPDGIAISRERHRQALTAALEALERAQPAVLAAVPPELVAVDVMIAADALGAITGAVGAEDVLDAVFRQFCIGK